MSRSAPPPLTVCLFCGSSDQVDPAYLAAARRLGRGLAERGVGLVYGGGGVGLMGAAARAAHEAGGWVLGVMPHFLRSRERLFDEVETIVVESMHERKRLMYDRSDAFIVAPGGVGTLEEVIELLSWKRLDLHRKPILFLDLDGYWAPLFRLLENTVRTGFTPEEFLTSYVRAADVEQALAMVEAMDGRDSPALPDVT